MDRSARCLLSSLPLALLLTAGCATNPATGRPQLALVGEDKEIELGRQSDQEVSEGLGLYSDAKAQAEVERVGRKIAADSERPNLPWSFKIVDDPVVNAFALPGGFVYVTRGLLAHLTSEAQLAAVLGHEIGHVTARHSVTQISKQRLAQIGVLAGAIVSPSLGSLAERGVNVLFLKYSRDDERQADDLGLRYLVREGYDPRQMPAVFALLKRVSEQQGGGRIPGWLSTHPGEDERFQRISAEVARLGGDFSGRTVNRAGYLQAIDGIAFGPDPRQGYFLDSRFVQPELGFELRFPAGWKTENGRQVVTAVSPGEDAVMVVALSGQRSAQAAAEQFYGRQGITRGAALAVDFGGLPAVADRFEASTGEGDLYGVAAFVEHGGRVYQILGLTKLADWDRYVDAMTRSAGSFARITDRRLLAVRPKRLEIVTLKEDMTIEELARHSPSTVDLKTLAILNQMNEGDRLPAGTLVKRVVGGELPG